MDSLSYLRVIQIHFTTLICGFFRVNKGHILDLYCKIAQSYPHFGDISYKPVTMARLLEGVHVS